MAKTKLIMEKVDKLEDDDGRRAVISYMERSHKDSLFCGESLLSLTLKKMSG